MAKIKLEKLTNDGKPTGEIHEFEEDHAEAILNMANPSWKKAQEKKGKEVPFDEKSN